MSWRTIHIKESEYIRLKLDNIEIAKEGEKYYVPLSDIAIIILEGNDTVITTKLLSAFSKHNIIVIICDDKYLPTGMYMGYGNYHRSAKRVQQQVIWAEEQKDLIWQYIIKQKISNQIAFASYRDIPQERLEMMIEFYSKVIPGDKNNREGHAAKVYFNSIYGSDFTRDDYCLENISMNFGYAIIRSAIARIVTGQGLMTMIGVFHCNEYNSFNLVDDLMEPFRPLMDYWIHKHIIGKSEYLSYESRLKIIDFINQPIKYKATKSTVDQVMLKYVTSFVKSMETSDPEVLHEIQLSDFMEEEV
ncbi:type II CRISPR-associated endonuclease Cas1 [Enterococcus sp. CWB-B31]|uniref:type II CRISPR-associated endonuclease Cas1 n=1 Tax=Enterococcus sp. CWB-B31 TaxID=2885159 RepID=UPI001E398B56|nr:type II CRISPR-associated endonuclease Cas1 [Enterococcus sp. CWB-B31]MCB5955767.1 type II CRISPR-associated endonuclease Cas1 [Enterococcus sp. CWB-B31]